MKNPFPGALCAAISLVMTGCQNQYESLSSPACAAHSSAQIARIAAGERNVSVPCATITYVRPEMGSDPDGVFLQAEANGPAVYLEMPLNQVASEYGFEPEPGLLVGFQVDGTMETDLRVRQEVHHFSDFTSYGPAPWPASALAQDLTGNPDFLENRFDLHHTLVSSSGRATSAFLPSGTDYAAAAYDTLEDMGEAMFITTIKARFPVELMDVYGIAGGCTTTIGPVPLWPRDGLIETTDRVYFTGWEGSLFDVHECAGGQVGAVVNEAEQVVLTLHVEEWDAGLLADRRRWWHPDHTEPGLFLVDGLPVTELVNDGPTLTLTVPGLPADPALVITFEDLIYDINGQRVFEP